MQLKTRSQHHLALALERVCQVKGESQEVSDRYGSLCHSFPVFVMTCGLCQALAFSKAKSAGDSGLAKAHELLLRHVAAVLNLDGDLLEAVQKASATDYMFYTRQVLDAWIYFKRFAESILKVPAGEGDRNDR